MQEWDNLWIETAHDLIHKEFNRSYMFLGVDDNDNDNDNASRSPFVNVSLIFVLICL
jgi:hypothetical protein